MSSSAVCDSCLISSSPSTESAFCVSVVHVNPEFEAVPLAVVQASSIATLEIKSTSTIASMRSPVVDSLPSPEYELDSGHAVTHNRYHDRTRAVGAPDFTHAYVHDVAKMRLFMERLALSLRLSVVDPLSPYEVGAPDFSYVHPIDEAKVRWFMDQLDGEPPLPYCDSSAAVCMYTYTRMCTYSQGPVVDIRCVLLISINAHAYLSLMHMYFR